MAGTGKWRENISGKWKSKPPSPTLSRLHLLEKLCSAYLGQEPSMLEVNFRGWDSLGRVGCSNLRWPGARKDQIRSPNPQRES